MWVDYKESKWKKRKVVFLDGQYVELGWKEDESRYTGFRPAGEQFMIDLGFDMDSMDLPDDYYMVWCTNCGHGVDFYDYDFKPACSGCVIGKKIVMGKEVNFDWHRESDWGMKPAIYYTRTKPE